MTSKVIVIIPARGGSKGIPRKNLRPLNGRPLIYYSIKACLNAGKPHRVVVSTEDEEIKLFAERFGADVVKRPPALSGDEVTIDPVVTHAVNECEKQWQEIYDIVLTVQPTSPLLSGEDIDGIIRTMELNTFDTAISVTEDRHLRWGEKDGKINPSYQKRVNRQLLPLEYKETGGIIACKRSVLEKGTRIGDNIGLQIVDSIKAIDIDSFNDFWLCEHILKRKRIVISVVGNAMVGMGHVYRTLMLAHEFVHYEVIFVCRESDDLAIKQIEKNNYRLEVTNDKYLLEKINSLQPDLVINDILDTDHNFIKSIQEGNRPVVNFEDIGSGAEAADLVINALYPHSIPESNMLVGHKYFCLRDEFIHIEKRVETNTVLKNVLITFGGVDEGNLTHRTLGILSTYMKQYGFDIDVILGPGFKGGKKLTELKGRLNSNRINIIHSTNKISEYMNKADFAVTSAGRTVFELASLDIPAVVICQNYRETTHTFASSENGFINLGIHTELEDEVIHKAFLKVIGRIGLREAMIKKMQHVDLKHGKKRVIEKITSLLK